MKKRIEFLNSELMLTLPKQVTAATGLDKRTYVIESYTCIRKNKFSGMYLIKVIKLISKLLIKYIKN